jgi:hypothetical protein
MAAIRFANIASLHGIILAYLVNYSTITKILSYISLVTGSSNFSSLTIMSMEKDFHALFFNGTGLNSP